MVKEGAYRKAIKMLGGRSACLTAAQEVAFAADLLPRTTRTDALCARASATPQPPAAQRATEPRATEP